MSGRRLLDSHKLGGVAPTTKLFPAVFLKPTPVCQTRPPLAKFAGIEACAVALR